MLWPSCSFEEEKPFLRHLEDLRRTLLWCGLFLAVGMLIAFPLVPGILRLVKQPLAHAGYDPDTFLRIFRVTGAFAIALRTALWSGALISAPFLILFLAWFVAPGLHAHERRLLKRSAGGSLALFAVGVLFGYRLILPAALRVMLNLNHWLGVSCEWVDLADYVSFVLRLLLAFGLAFELPVVVLLLGGLGLVSVRSLVAVRPYVHIGCLVLAMILTPPDPMTQLMLAIPMMLLYETSIVLLRLLGHAVSSER